MAIPPDNNTPSDGLATIAGFRGLNNRIDPEALGLQWQLRADNTLLDDAQHHVLRPGYGLFLSDVADLFGTRDERLFVVTTAGSLYEVQASGAWRLRAIGFTGAPFQWAELGSAIFAQSETTAWVIYPRYVAAWGVPSSSEPSVSVIAGNFPAGSYAVACILQAPDGRLGGCSGITRITLSGNQGITVTAPAVYGYTTRLYLSVPDGADLYTAGTLTSGAISLPVLPPLGARLLTQNLYPPPQGSVISAFGNRMVVGAWEPNNDRSVLYYSQAESPHLFDLYGDHQLIPGRITLLAAVAFGLVIATDRAIWIDNGQTRQRVADYGATANHDYDPSGNLWFWSQRGACRVNAADLSFTNLTDAALALPAALSAQSAILSYQGSRYLIACQKSAMDATIPLAYVPLSLSTPISGTARGIVTASGALASG